MKPIKIFFSLFVLIFLVACLKGNHFSENRLTDDMDLSEASSIANGDSQLKEAIQEILSTMERSRYYPELDILNPYHGTIFPIDIASPEFKWSDENHDAVKWLITIGFENNRHFIRLMTEKNSWTPDKHIWEVIKTNSVNKKAYITIFGIKSHNAWEIVSQGSIIITTSSDEVGAPIFYKQVPPHFGYAYKHPELCKWRLGNISSYGQPSVVLEGLPVCANCHSFSRNGRKFGMDIDYKNDKGAYALTSTRAIIEMSEDDFITWNNFPQKDNRINMGLFSKVSPDGSYVVSTVNEKNFMALMNDLDFSQLFFTYEGIIAYYSNRSKTFHSLPGADNSNYVQTSPAWSPDGRYVIFSRAKIKEKLKASIADHKPSEINSDTRIDDLNQKFQIQYNIFRVPFNQGNGGIPVPIKGASYNGKSNYCGRYSPDGKWIVFNQSQTGLLLQPDSQLYILPTEGGLARKMNCNTDIMNSWHSWAPNSRWIVFASKINTPFTELFLTHIDKNGNDSPPVLLSRLNSSKYAAHLPEFMSSNKIIMKKINLNHIFPSMISNASKKKASIP